MGAHREAVDVQSIACWALCHLAFSADHLDFNSDNAERMVGAGSIEAVMEAMGAHRDSETMQVNACFLLMLLAARNEDNRARIASAGGIEAVVESMDRHQDSGAVQRQACFALLRLAEDTSALARMRAAGSVRLIRAVRAAMEASNAREHTKEWGRELLEKL